MTTSSSYPGQYRYRSLLVLVRVFLPVDEFFVVSVPVVSPFLGTSKKKRRDVSNGSCFEITHENIPCTFCSRSARRTDTLS